MTRTELNQKIIEYFPELQDAYINEVSWQEGDETGSHVVYGTVFTPYFEQNLNARKMETLVHMFRFIEDILSMEDKSAENVIALSVIAGNESKLQDSELLQMLGVQTKKLLTEMVTADIPR